MGFVGQIVVERTDGGNFPSSGRGIETIVSTAAVWVLRTLTAEVCHIAVYVRQRHAGNQIKIHIHDADLIQSHAGQRRIMDLFDIAEKISKIQEIFINSSFGMSFDIFVIREEVSQNLRSLSAIVGHIAVLRVRSRKISFSWL